jgi:hypothetical protein
MRKSILVLVLLTLGATQVMANDSVNTILDKNLGSSQGYGMPGETCGIEITENSASYSISLITNGQKISGMWIMDETDFKLENESLVHKSTSGGGLSKWLGNGGPKVKKRVDLKLNNQGKIVKFLLALGDNEEICDLNPGE